MPTSASPTWDPIALSHEDQAAMPGSLREALLAWHQQHRALQTGASWQDAQAVPEAVTLDQLMRATLQAVHGTMDVAHLQGWMGRFTVTERPHQDHRLRLLELVVEARRADLLDMVVQHPALLPVVAPRPPAEKALAQVRRRPFTATPFNGAMHLAQRRAINGDGPGLVFLDLLHEQWPAFQASRDPLVKAFPYLGRDRQRAGMEVEQAVNQQAARVAGAQRQITHRVSLVPGAAMKAALKKAVGARRAYHLNIVGMAVLHGWSDGLQRLLDAGVDPYAPATPKRASHSALMIACAFNEPACARALLNHASFAPSARFGSTPQELAQRGGGPSETELWRQVDPSLRGGYEWNVLCRSRLMEDAAVREAMMARWQRLPAATQARFRQDDPVAANRWEQEVLRSEIQTVRPASTLSDRVRSRL